MFEINHIFTKLQKALKKKNATGITACGLLLNHLEFSITNHSEAVSRKECYTKISDVFRDMPGHQPM